MIKKRLVMCVILGISGILFFFTSCNKGTYLEEGAYATIKRNGYIIIERGCKYINPQPYDEVIIAPAFFPDVEFSIVLPSFREAKWKIHPEVSIAPQADVIQIITDFGGIPLWQLKVKALIKAVATEYVKKRFKFKSSGEFLPENFRVPIEKENEEKFRQLGYRVNLAPLAYGLEIH